MKLMDLLRADSLDWSAVGVIGGAIYATYQTITSAQIKNAVMELKLTIQDRFATVEKTIAVNYERHLTLAGSVKELQDQILQLQKDIAFRDGKVARE